MNLKFVSLFSVKSKQTLLKMSLELKKSKIQIYNNSFSLYLFDNKKNTYLDLTSFCII